MPKNQVGETEDYTSAIIGIRRTYMHLYIRFH